MAAARVEHTQACLSRSFSGAALSLCVLKSQQSRHSSLSAINNLLPSPTVSEMTQPQQPWGGREDHGNTMDLRNLKISSGTCPENTKKTKIVSSVRLMTQAVGV